MLILSKVQFIAADTVKNPVDFLEYTSVRDPKEQEKVNKEIKKTETLLDDVNYPVRKTITDQDTFCHEESEAVRQFILHSGASEEYAAAFSDRVNHACYTGNLN